MNVLLLHAFPLDERMFVGEHDPFVSADELGDYDVREVTGAGHLLNLERPGEFNEILRDFLARV